MADDSRSGAACRHEQRQLDYSGLTGQVLVPLGLRGAAAEVVRHIHAHGQWQDNCTALQCDSREFARAIGYSKTQLLRAVTELEQAGLLRVARRPGQPNSYLIDWCELRHRAGQRGGNSDPFAAFKNQVQVKNQLQQPGPVCGPVSGPWSGPVSGPSDSLLFSESGPEGTGEERLKEGKIENINHSFNHSSRESSQALDSAGGAEPGPLVTLALHNLHLIPSLVWSTRNDRVVQQKLDDWWQVIGSTQPAIDWDSRCTVLGAVLLAREREADYPQRYVAACLRNGVAGRWRAKAEQLLRATVRS